MGQQQVGEKERSERENGRRTLYEVLVGGDLLGRRAALDDLEQGEEDALGVLADVALAEPARGRRTRSASAARREGE